MRILKADTVYPAFAAALYARAGLAAEPYDAQLQVLYDQCFGTSDGYVRHLGVLGHETHHVVTNCVPLQAAWLRERGLPADGAARLMERPGRWGRAAQQAILVTQVELLRPDVLFLDDLWEVNDRLLDWLRTRVPFLVSQLASHPPPIERIRRFDLMLSSFPHFVEWFRGAGIDSEPFGLGFIERVAERLAAEGVDTSATAADRAGVVLVGGLNPEIYPAVTPALERLCAEVEVAVYGYDVERLLPGSAIRERFRGPAWGLDMYRLFAQARVVVNRHGDIAAGYANNMRLYEATGVGAALVTEAAPNLGQILEPGIEVATYADGDELVGQVKSLLANEARAESIATAGQARTLREHTYAERMRQLSAMLEERAAAGRFRSVRRRS